MSTNEEDGIRVFPEGYVPSIGERVVIDGWDKTFEVTKIYTKIDESTKQEKTIVNISAGILNLDASGNPLPQSKWELEDWVVVDGICSEIGY